MYWSIVREQSTSYLDRLYALLYDAQAQSEFPGRFCILLSDNGHSLHVGDTDSYDERRCGTLPLPAPAARLLTVSLLRKISLDTSPTLFVVVYVFELELARAVLICLYRAAPSDVRPSRLLVAYTYV